MYYFLVSASFRAESFWFVEWYIHIDIMIYKPSHTVTINRSFRCPNTLGLFSLSLHGFHSGSLVYLHNFKTFSQINWWHKITLQVRIKHHPRVFLCAWSPLVIQDWLQSLIGLSNWESGCIGTWPLISMLNILSGFHDITFKERSCWLFIGHQKQRHKWNNVCALIRN